MKNNEKKAILLPGLLGAGIGAAASPEGHYGAGAIHGAGRGIGLDVGAGVGGVAGGLAGLGLGAGVANVVPEQYRGLAMGIPTVVGALGGAGLGGYGGYHAGAGIAKGITGKKAPWQQTAKKKPAPKKKPEQDDESEPAKKAASALQQACAAVAADTSLSLSEKATKCASLIKAAEGTRTWADWADDSNDDRTFLGFKKTDARLQHDAERLRQQGDKALPVDAARNPGLAKAMSGGERAGGAGGMAGLDMSNPLLHAGGGALAGGAAGAMLGPKNRLRNTAIGAALGGAGTYVGSHLAQGGNMQSMLNGLGLGSLMGKTSSEKAAFDFGKLMADGAQHARYLYNNVPEGISSGIGLGGVGGAALGGLAGLMAPGYEDEYDDEGNVIGRKQRGRLGAALRGVLGGGAAGAALGGAVGHFAPEHTKSVMSNVGKSVGDMQQYGRGLYDRMFKPQLTSTPQTGRPGSLASRPQTMMA